ncbi:hypothetical protein GGP41_004984 [Bipolaris sorokiniana]|uniref:DNA-(apurinic or apyrimidinic site) lyase n=1 Tax=Cochliobolus sativus TaxID=45130 RepID=A0A8H5ZKS5_COCSA|nr:hypothetical protein GGP41_004984 [Bipolaris sorokiniana]
MALRAAEWHKLPTSLTELCIDTTLRCGQSFRWRKSAEGEWSAALHGRILSLRQDPQYLHYRVTYPSITTTLPTPPLSNAPSVAPEEDDTLALAHLMKLGFGYRAKYIAKTARIVSEDKGLKWLEDLSNPEYPQFGVEEKPAGDMLEGGREGYRKAHEELLALHGVGPKVADCVCLFGLGWSESVPVDTHVWQIAQRDYRFGKGKHSSLTAATYVAIGNLFRKLWGKEAGWAHSVLFTADLKAFSERVIAKVEVKEEEVVIKKEDEETVMETAVKEVTKRKRIKKEPLLDEGPIVQVKQEPTRRSKRQRV